MKKNTIILTMAVIGLVFLIWASDENLRNLTSNLINLRFSKSDEFIYDYTRLFNQTWDEMNQCIIRCPLLPRMNYIAEDCIIRCDEKKNETLMKRLTEKYSSEEITKYKELDEIRALNMKIGPLYECTNSCGRILLEKDCVNSCLYPLDKKNSLRD